MGFELLTVLSVKISIFWVVTSCFGVHRYQCFEGTCFLQLQKIRVNLTCSRCSFTLKREVARSSETLCNRSHTTVSCANSSKLFLAWCAGFVGLLSWSVVHLILCQGVFWLAVNQERETTTFNTKWNATWNFKHLFTELLYLYKSNWFTLLQKVQTDCWEVCIRSSTQAIYDYQIVR
jgi:hypothetical protein